MAKVVDPILVVDDDRVTSAILCSLLKGAGFMAICDHDLASAEATLAKTSASLLLLDVHLPDGDGVAFCRRLRALPSMDGLPVLLISADHDVATKVDGFDAGAVDYITKPISGPETLARVRTHLRLRAASEALVEREESRVRALAASQATFVPDAADLPHARFQVVVKQALRAGGDFCEVLPSGEGSMDYIVADVSGHDLGASLWTAAFKTLLGEYATPLFSPKDVCQKLDRSLLRLLPEAAYVTAIYARINRNSNRLVLVNAGHPPAILVQGATGKARILDQEGDILGMFTDSAFGTMELGVRPGDRLFLYTDGLVERDGLRAEGTRRLLEECETSFKKPLSDAIPRIVENMHPGAIEDDIVLLGTEV